MFFYLDNKPISSRLGKMRSIRFVRFKRMYNGSPSTYMTTSSPKPTCKKAVKNPTQRLSGKRTKASMAPTSAELTRTFGIGTNQSFFV